MSENREVVHIHTHTCHSFLDGLSSVEELVARSKELGFDSLAITDHGNIFSWVKAYQACNKAGIKWIAGTEAYLTDDHTNKRRSAHHLIILAENQIGLQNIIRLTTCANRNFYYKPRIDFKDLENHREGLIISNDMAKRW
jgi:DNA polymerase-3 subunit alpha